MDPAEVGRQIKKAYPEYSDMSDEELGQRYLLKNKPDVALGATDPEKQLKQSEAQAELDRIKQVGGGVSSKQAGSKEVIDQLFEIYYGKPGEESLALVTPGEYRTSAQLKTLWTKVQAGEANSIEERIYKYNRVLESKRGLLARAAGDVGNLAIQEQINAGKGLPGADATPQEASTLFASAYDAFAGGKRPPRLDEELMLQEQGQLETPQTQTNLPTIPQNQPKKPQNGLGPIDKLMMPIAKGPIGGLADIALNLLPEYKKAIQKSAKGEKVGLGEIGAAAGDVATTAIPMLRIGKLGLAGKAALAGGVRGATRDIPLTERPKEAIKEGVIGGVLGNILKPKTLVKTFGSLARKGTQNIKIPTKPMLEAAQDYARDVPVKSPLAQSIIEALKKRTEITLPEVEKKLGRWGALAYTKSEEPRAKAESQLINAVYGAARKQIAEKAPMVSSARTLSDIQGKAIRGLGKVFNPITIGAGITGFAGYKLGERLFGGNR